MDTFEIEKSFDKINNDKGDFFVNDERDVKVKYINGEQFNGEAIVTNSCCNFEKFKGNNDSTPIGDQLDSIPSQSTNLNYRSYEESSELSIITTEKEAVLSPISDYTHCSQDLDDTLHPLSERWSPLGANYDDTLSQNESDLHSPVSELELLSVGESPKKHDLNNQAEIYRLRHMEEEQEILTSSLLALTSHFAHVQLRVRQIVEASPHERDQLLKDLNEFAFQGIPENVSSNAITAASETPEAIKLDDASTRQRQSELIEHLKSQLSELEKLAYESGAPVLPQHILLEKQKVIIDELKNKLNLKVEDHDLPQLSSEQLKSQVDNAIGEFIGPLKMKDKLVAQLKTQITDLERFIAFLQCDSDDTKLKTLNGSNEKFTEAYNSYAAKKKRSINRKTSELDKSEQKVINEEYAVNSLKASTSNNALLENQSYKESLNSKAHGLMDKASVLMQMFATTHFGAKPDSFQKNTLKKTSKGNHWGDLRAQLEVDIQEVSSLATTLSFDKEKLKNFKLVLKSAQNKSRSVDTVSTIQPSSYRNRQNEVTVNSIKPYTLSSDSDEDTYDCYDWTQNVRRAKYKGDSVNAISRELTTAIRKNFAMTLQRLIQHGLREEIASATTSLMVPFMRCFNPSPVFATESNSFRSRECNNPHSFMAYDATEVPYRNNEGDEYNSNSNFLGVSNTGMRPMHAWELILEYYYLKHGEEFNNTPARKLSQSFNLEIVDSRAVTAKQNLLTTIGIIIAMHRPYKRSFNAHFKAFVCSGLNAHQLVEWLNLIFSCSDLIETFYSSNSYVMRTGFRDSLRSIDNLTKYDFDLPVDLAVRHFKNI